jgi:Tfp pilus assembly protein PilZ
VNSGREKRVFPRWTLHAAVDVATDDTVYGGLSFDVSAGGIFVATIDTPPIGSEVDVMVMLPDGTRLQLAGTVRWVREPACATPGLPAGCGIEWDDLPMEALRSLLHFAELREPLLWTEPEMEP